MEDNELNDDSEESERIYDRMDEELIEEEEKLRPIGCDCRKENMLVKNGFRRDHQRYRCKKCGKTIVIPTLLNKSDIRRFAIILYLEGMSYKRIAERLSVEGHTVGKWIKELDGKLRPFRNLRSIKFRKTKNIKLTPSDDTKYSEEDNKMSSGLFLIEQEHCTVISLIGDTILDNPYKKRSPKKWRKGQYSSDMCKDILS